MRFLYGKQEMRTLARSQESCFLLTNGLGGYASLTCAYLANRCGFKILEQKLIDWAGIQELDCVSLLEK